MAMVHARVVRAHERLVAQGTPTVLLLHESAKHWLCDSISTPPGNPRFIRSACKARFLSITKWLKFEFTCFAVNSTLHIKRLHNANAITVCALALS